MSTVSVLNTDSGLSGKTIDLLESDQTITGAKTFDRDPSAPFIVTSGSAKVTNLDADKLDGQDGPASAIVGLTDSQTLTNKTLTAPAISQIVFPAIQVPAAGVNTLDDYEEGSWTPVLGGSGGTSGQTYGTQVGRYIKIGKLVTCFGQIGLTAKGTITGSLQIQGLPFTSENTTGLYGTVQIGSWGTLGAAAISIYGYVAPNGTFADIRLNGSANVDSGQPDTSFVANTSALLFSIIYQAAN